MNSIPDECPLCILFASGVDDQFVGKALRKLIDVMKILIIGSGSAAVRAGRQRERFDNLRDVGRRVELRQESGATLATRQACSDCRAGLHH
ncbi:MAG: hypothetical protein GY903_31075 [Fuerstiella sp.]|nr:hypothetical protein [Fuerstiella sp.]MCP4858935.1 hypothetical protein [Fuerstiella sp.]